MPLVNIVTVHYRNAEWAKVQYQYVDRYAGSYEIHACMNDCSYDASRYKTVCNLQGGHKEKLCTIADRIASEDRRDREIILFLDGDAFPIKPINTKLDSLLLEYPAVGVRRLECPGEDDIPHILFTAVRVGNWRGTSGRWKDRMRQIIGKKKWYRLYRSNSLNFHPLFFGIYGTAVYHHGAGFRSPKNRVDNNGGSNEEFLATISKMVKARIDLNGDEMIKYLGSMYA